MVVCLVAAGLCLANLFSISGFFQTLERSGGGLGSEKQMLTQLQNIQQQMKLLDDPEIVRRQLQAFEASIGSGINSDKIKTFRQAFAPIVSAFATRPKEAESRFLLVKKREIMENLVNAYRKEIPHGKIPVRAAYLNILFDTQNSLLNEGDETEQVYIRRSKERLSSLRAFSVSDQGLSIRVDNLEKVFQAYERGFEQAMKWRQVKEEALAKSENSLPKLAKELHTSNDGQVEDLRRYFLYSCILALASIILAYGIFYLAHKMLKLKFYTRTDSFLRILREFGRDRIDPGHERELKVLLGDPDWSTLTEGMVEAEAAFVSKYQTLLAVPKSIGIPFAVFGKNRVIKHWNPAAITLFGMSEKTNVSLDDLICEKRVAPSSGEAASFIDLVRSSFSTTDEDVFELSIRSDNTWVPYELISSPITSGPLAGGRVYIFREIRKEAERVDQAVSYQLKRVRAYLQKVTSGSAVELVAGQNDVPAVCEIVSDLQVLKRTTEERELLWKTENEAVIHQVARQKEILQRLTTEISGIRDAHRKALELVSGIHGGDEHWHDEVCSLQREVERWQGIRSRLETDLGHQGGVLNRAKAYEKEARLSAAELDEFLEGYEGVLEELKRFSEDAKIHAVNMGFVKDPAGREFAARSRAFAHEIGRFIEHAERLSGKVREFLSSHPASALAPHLESSELDPSVVVSLRQEEERLASFIHRWRESGEELVLGGEEALLLLREAEKKSALLSQLGETSILINDQTKGNLERWN